MTLLHSDEVIIARRVGVDEGDNKISAFNTRGHCSFPISNHKLVVIIVTLMMKVT